MTTRTIDVVETIILRQKLYLQLGRSLYEVGRNREAAQKLTKCIVFLYFNIVL